MPQKIRRERVINEVDEVIQAQTKNSNYTIEIFSLSWGGGALFGGRDIDDIPARVTTHNSKERSRRGDCCMKIELDPSLRWRDPRDKGWGQLGFPSYRMGNEGPVDVGGNVNKVGGRPFKN